MLRLLRLLVLLLLLVSSSVQYVRAAPRGSPTSSRRPTTTTALLNEFSKQFWAWRSVWAPITSDDLPRTAVVRPDYWPSVNVSAAAFVQQRVEYEGFVAKMKILRETSAAIGADGGRRGSGGGSGSGSGGGGGIESWDRDDQADYFALTSALARTYFELYVWPAAWRDPGFYLQQSVGSVWDALVRQPLTWDGERVLKRLLPRVQAVAAVLSEGRSNLMNGSPVQVFRELYLDTVGFDPSNPNATARSLGDALRRSLAALANACAPPLNATTLAALTEASSSACDALTSFTQWVATGSTSQTGNVDKGKFGVAGDDAVLVWDTSPAAAVIGEDRYHWFLQHVSFANYSSADLVQLGRQQLARADALLAVETRRNDATGVPPAAQSLPLATSVAAQISATSNMSTVVTEFLEDMGLLHFDDWWWSSPAPTEGNSNNNNNNNNSSSSSSSNASSLSLIHI